MHLNRHSLATRRTWGFSTVELLVSLGVSAVAAGTVLPAAEGLFQRHELTAAAATVRTDLQHARSLAIARQESVRFQVMQDASGTSCYVVHTGPAGSCDCTSGTVAACTDGAVALRTASLASRSGVRLQMNSASILFDGTHGTVTPTATLQLANRQGQSLRLITNIMGRVRQCSVDGSEPTLAAC